MAYTFNKSEAVQNDLVSEGDYEVQIERIEKKTLPVSGKEKLSVMFRIRSDVEQPNKNRVVFEDIWSEKSNPEFFNRKRINQLMGTQKIEDGRVFDTISDVIDFLDGSYLRIHVAIEFDDYSGRDRNQVKYYMSSKFGKKELAKPEPETEAIPIMEDELPF